ncbi:hypothetical protein [Legionella pneumophila]|uniref:hypothetical protein n=1 Tax=Legionella pneumophila TaxID=446 RepID=UPI000B098F13|nr:hypothetical protein [Legionella pneumophila]
MGLDLIDSYEKFLEITKINAKVTFNFQILNYQRYAKLVDSYQQYSQAKSLSGLNTSANSQLFFKKRDSTGQDRVSITTGQAGVAHDTVGLGLEWNEAIQNTISENMMNQKL